MQITTAQLLAVMPRAQANAARNKNWFVNGKPLDITTATMLINKYAAECGITSALHWIHFLANVAVESGELRYSEENLNYSAAGLVATWPKRFNATTSKQYAYQPAKIANFVYANRNGNGSVQSGDGWKYRGRGLIQYTGKANYAEYAKWCGYDVVDMPDLMAQRVGSFRSAAHYFAKHCLGLAAADAGFAVRKAINGGANGWTECQRYVTRAKKVFL